MIDAVIVSTARTGLAKSWKGAFNMTYGATLGGHAVQHAVARSGLDPNEIEDCIMGGSLAEGTTGGNVARAIALRAGLPVTVPGMTIDRQCSSGLMTIATAAKTIMAGEQDIAIAGGRGAFAKSKTCSKLCVLAIRRVSGSSPQLSEMNRRDRKSVV